MLLGDCLANAPAAYQPQAVNVLRDALENAPNAPQAAASWVNLAFALETLGELDSAVEAFSQALFLEWHSERRAVIYHERGRMQLGSGALEAAIGDFEAGLSSGFGAEARALAHWSLGVAHDRNHDFPTAIPHLLEGYRARFGSNGATLIIDLDDSIIWPPEERHYYRALALLAEAMEERAVNHGRFISLLVESQFVWLSYLQDAPAESLGVPRAREHLQWVREQLQQDDVETDADLDEQLLRPAW
jgi:tetratricopeptide (TPR) repeat protein